MSPTWRTVIASAAAFGLGVVTATAYRPTPEPVAQIDAGAEVTPTDQEQDLAWKLDGGTLHVHPQAPQKSFVAVATSADSPGWIQVLPSDRETSLPVSDVDDLIVAEVKPISRWQGEVLLPCQPGVCTPPPPPELSAGGRTVLYDGYSCVPGAPCAGQDPRCEPDRCGD